MARTSRPLPRAQTPEEQADQVKRASKTPDKGIRLSIADAVDLYVYGAISPEQFAAALVNRGKAPDVIEQARESCVTVRTYDRDLWDTAIGTITKQLGG